MSGFADDGFGEDVLALSAPQEEKKRVISKKSKNMNRQRKEEEEALAKNKKKLKKRFQRKQKRLSLPIPSETHFEPIKFLKFVKNLGKPMVFH